MATHPSQRERRAFDKLMVRRSLVPAVYDAYRRRVAHWQTVHQHTPAVLIVSGARVRVTRTRIVRSQLFGCEYLVG